MAAHPLSTHDYVYVESTAPLDYHEDLISHAATFRNLLSVIQDEVDDQSNDYTNQIQRCIFSAIRYCERERFFFSYEPKVTFQTRAGVAAYTKEDCPQISTAIGIQSVSIVGHEICALRHLNCRSELPMCPDQVPSRPLYWHRAGDQLIFYPIPDMPYVIQMVLSHARLGEIKDIDEIHPWLVYAFDLIKYRAKYEFYKNIQKDIELAALSAQDFMEQLEALRSETSQRSHVHHVERTVF